MIFPQTIQTITTAVVALARQVPGRNALCPEHIIGLRVSVACYIHDCWWAKCERTFAEFKQSNGVFKDNLMELNRVFSGSWLERAARWPIIYAWWLLVSGKQGLRHFIA